MSEMLKDAKQAAEYTRGLQEFCDRPRGDGFDLLSAGLSLFGKLPKLHIREDVLEQISPRDKWSWEQRDDIDIPFEANVEIDGAVFFAILNRQEAIEYGCPQEVLDAAQAE